MYNEKLYSIKYQDIREGIEIYTDDDTHGHGVTKFKVLEKIMVPTKNIIILKCINLELNIDQDIKINMSYQRDIWTTKLYSGWRQI